MNRNIKAAAKRRTELVTPKETPSMKKWLENWRQRQHCNFCRQRFRVQEGSELALFPTSWRPDQWHVGCTTTDHMRPPETAGKRVLLISHDRELRRQLHSCLSTAGIATTALTTVRNGNECLAALAKMRPRLIVLDDSTTNLDGPGLLGALHQNASEALVVYLTISHTLELERAVRQSGVLYYTEKPPDSSLLTKLLATVFTPLPETNLCHASTVTYSASRR
jgi:CheY-like chemotaxis protein